MGATVVTGARHAQMPGLTTYDTATVAVLADGFRARGLTFENAAGPGAHQAVAFRSDSDMSVLEHVEFRGHQDTLYARSLRQLYSHCRISGTVDFIFGNAAAVFDSCLIEVVPRLENPEKGERNAVTAHGRTDPSQPTGFVFYNCTVTGSAEYLELYRKKPRVHRVYLGRPWKEYSRTVFVRCYFGEVVRPEGWLPWRGDFALKTLFYGEYGSLGPGANASARVEWSSQIEEEHLGVYSPENFIQGDEWVAC
ncbi:probable pectinesterase/pectinesterase inhibitor 51 [Ananas comosus]|uniref:Pectinesterase n=1 Tax=Ananas comosus TaxID=4615 RepID=A0A6P5ELR2_ANACO|nr:probable pectinesterase/pectinesterase inhibitor 51 [Ananas comosus]